MPDLPNPVIAVDGTAASGKSTFSRQLAEKLGYVYINTGAMYRGVTWYLLSKKLPLTDFDMVGREVDRAGVETRIENGELAFFVAGQDPLPHVREGRINEGVSMVAQVALVRRLLVAQQQKLVEQAPLVMEGRDIGTVVFPQTPYKFFLDASAEVRAQRRYEQGEVDMIHKRDTIDLQRSTSPLMCAANALRLDSGSASVEELVDMALQHLAKLGLKDLA